MRLVALVVGLIAVVVVPFLVWGEAFERLFSVEGTVDWLAAHGRWAWVAGIALLAADLVLPIPGTAVMSALGYLYGPLVGTVVGCAGAVLAGAIGYGLSRALGERGARAVLGDRDLERARRLFAGAGGWIVAVSRWMPVLPEVVACVAGLARMPVAPFLIASTCGAFPLAAVFAVIGGLGVDRPGLALGLSAGLPPVLWFLTGRLVARLAS